MIKQAALCWQRRLLHIRLKVFDETQDVEDLISEIRGKLTDISSLNTEHDCIQINPVIDEVYKLIQKAATRTDGLSGLESGFTRLDKMTCGWQNGDLITIGARPAMGCQQENESQHT